MEIPMKNTVVAAALLVSALCSNAAHAAVQVVTSTQDLAALTAEVGGADVVVSTIARGDLDPHFIDAKPSFMVKLASADMVVVVGMELEIGWMPALLTGARNAKIQPGSRGYLDASTAIVPIEVPSGSMDRSRGDLHPQGNPHYWLDPENGRRIARVIEARLIELDPTHAVNYQRNLGAFEAKLTQKEADWAAKMAPLKGASVVGYHSTYDYFFSRYGLKIVGFVEPKPGIPPTPSHTLELGAAAKAAGAKFVVVEPFHNPADATPIATASGAKVVTVPSAVGGLADVKTYFDLFDRIVFTLTGK
jgi:ABC-type Zn uptake system ZnuABC Zn-binding protein ZnuA